MFKLDTIANQFITDMSKVYNLRFGESFDKNKANCAWFTGEFYKWAKSKDLNVKVVYFDSNIEAHIAPMIDDKVIDFSVKQFTKNPNDNYLILIPEDYKKYGYDKFEIYDEMPKLETIFPADKIQESMSGTNVREDLTEICYELTDGRFGIKIYDDPEFPGWGHIPGSGMNLPYVERGDKILCIYLSDYRDYDGFSFDEVRDVVLRVVDYLGRRYKGCSVLSVSEHERSSINRREIVEHRFIGKLKNLIIIYK
jgi:hypothetical protein